MKELGFEGLNNMLAAYEDKSAQAVCTFAYCAGPGKETLLFEGRTDGKIVPARGTAFFGWGAVFEHEGKTYAYTATQNGMTANVRDLVMRR
jgi:inosine triphosphate pyrophosphatase